MRETEPVAGEAEETILRYGTIIRFLHGTRSEAILNGFGNMFDFFGTAPELIESRVTLAILERFGSALDTAAEAESVWQAVEEAATDVRIENVIGGASCPRIALPPSQLLEQIENLSPGIAKRVAEKAPKNLLAVQRSDEAIISSNLMFRQVGQGVGLTFLIFPLMLAVAAAAIGEPFLSATSLSLTLTTYLAKIKSRAWSHNLKSRNLEIASRLLRYAVQYQAIHQN